MGVPFDSARSEDAPEARYSDVLESTKAALYQEAPERETAARESFVKVFQDRLDVSVGNDGEVVVMPFDSAASPCQGIGYLHETFVHSDLLMGTFICKPCHEACSEE